MPHQEAVTVRAPVRDGELAGLTDLLRRMRDQGDRNEWVDFPQLLGVHFARLFVLDEVRDLKGRPIPASLVYMADVDGRAVDHLRDLATCAGVDALFGACAGYPGSPTPAERAAWLAGHQLRPAARYVHTVGRALGQVHDEARLYVELEQMLDRPDLPRDGSAAGYRSWLADRVRGRSDLAWAGRPPDGVDLAFRVRETVHLVAVPAAALVLMPVLLPLAVVGVLVIRVKEGSDPEETGPVDLRHAEDVEEFEDWAAQNPFTAVGFVKPGVVRALAMRVALLGLDYANRHWYARDNLAGVRSIHFARWVPLDGGRRVIFASSYDGSQESYMNDFIDRLAWGLNLVFSNGVGYPRTRWLLFGGAKDETGFKRYLRRHQVPTVVWYSAYPRYPAPTVDQASRVRAGFLPGAESSDPAGWLALL